MKRKVINFGFTLVELMVVISIIGILASIVYANFGSSRIIARDNVRKTDLKDMQVALELFKAQNGRYPYRCLTLNDTKALPTSRATTSASWSGNVHGDYQCSNGTDQYIEGLVPDYIAALPLDPSDKTFSATSNNGYLYLVNGAGTAYKFLANNSVEKLIITACGDNFARFPDESTKCTAPITSPNAYAVYKGVGSLNF